MEVLVGGLDLFIQLGDAFVDVLLLPGERVGLLLDLPLLLVRVRNLRPELLEGFLRRLDSVGGSTAPRPRPGDRGALPSGLRASPCPLHVSRSVPASPRFGAR